MARIAVILTDRANYGRLAPVMDALHEHPQFELLPIVGGSMLLSRFAHPVDDLSYPIAGRVWCEVEGSMPMSIGMATQGFTRELERLQPDYCIVIGDRFETLGAATAAACLRIPLIHFQGGEVSGSLDNKWRHAITQLADFHVPATRDAANRINYPCSRVRALMVLGRYTDIPPPVLAIGCPSSDLAARVEYDDVVRTGPIMVSFHPDTALDRDYSADMDDILAVCKQYYMCNVYWPNIDSGSDRISKTIRRCQKESHSDFKTIINQSPNEYLRDLANASCCVGNSSSFVRDASFFGTPVVLVGNRQLGRECAENVMHVPCEREAIREAVRKQVAHGRYQPSKLYGDGHVTERFIKALEELCCGGRQNILDSVGQLSKSRL